MMAARCRNVPFATNGVRPRALAQHQTTRNCLEARAWIEARGDVDLIAARRGDWHHAYRVPMVPDCLPAIFGVLLASSWRMVKLEPWGQGAVSSELWLL
jgi:hypothetical protein